MNGQILQKHQQKELNLMRMACENTRNYIFSLPREKRRENRITKNELVC